MESRDTAPMDGSASPFVYLVGIGLCFVNPMLGWAMYAAVAGYVGRPDAKGDVGVYRRPADGGAWHHVLRDLETFTVAVHPVDSNVVLAGTADGVWRSTDRGETFARAVFPDTSKQIWSFLVDARNPDRIYAGGSPVDIYRSDDRGANWRRLPNPGIKDRAKAPFQVRVMRMAQHPTGRTRSTPPSRSTASPAPPTAARPGPTAAPISCACPSCPISRARSSATPLPRACWMATPSLSAPPIPTPWCSPAAWACSAARMPARAGRTWRCSASRPSPTAAT
ncbi:MAG: hypothetical protein HC869_21425 [Rhodospirillales bacterium]|nr:hypothetical protein [Rhodospirillales bacterium]